MPSQYYFVIFVFIIFTQLYILNSHTPTLVKDIFAEVGS